MEATKTPLSTTMIVEEELKRINAPHLRREMRRLADAVMTLGIVEIAAGLCAIALPFITSAFFPVLLGAVLLIGGITHIVNAVVHASLGRMILGSVYVLAGALAIAHPILGLSFLTLLLGIYLLATGFTRLFMADAAGWDIAGGIAGILLGGMVLAGWPGTSLFTLGLIIGINLLFGGSATLSVGARLRRPFMMPQTSIR